jgi:hypothetical protein
MDYGLSGIHEAGRVRGEVPGSSFAQPTITFGPRRSASSNSNSANESPAAQEDGLSPNRPLQNPPDESPAS